jgi:hypothetical protein
MILIKEEKMRYLLIVVIILLAVMPVYAGQVVYANFDDLPVYTIVGYHYPGSIIHGETVSDYAVSAPNAVSSSNWKAITFPGGAHWVSLYITGVPLLIAKGLDGVSIGSVTINDGPWWSFTELRFDEPIGWIEVPALWLNGYRFDDVTYELVPEPASLASLAGIIGLFGVGYRRRKIIV